MQESSSVFALQSHEIEEHWRWIEPHLLRVKEPPWKVSDVKSALLNQEAQLWANRSGIVITRLGKCGDTPTGFIWIAAGSLGSGLDIYYHHIEPWFIEKGCSFVEIVGRRGWKRLFQDFDESGVILTKRLK